MRARLGWLLSLIAVSSAPAGAQDFWAHWADGKAELNGFRLVQPRYGAKRPGTAVLIFVNEAFSESARVKADPGKHPKTDVFPVLKLNAVRDFQTGIYDYNVMTSVFARVSPGWPVAKVSFSSQEWCGHVFHLLIPRGERIESVRHSYFDGEADAAEQLDAPKDGVYADVLPILLRGWGMAYLKPGERRTVPFLPSLLTARLEHKPLVWGKAVIAREAALATVTVPAGRFAVVTWTIAHEGGPTTTYQIEADAPYRIVRWAVDTGEEGELLGSERLTYWEMNGPGNEQRLKELGLKPLPGPAVPGPPARPKAK